MTDHIDHQLRNTLTAALGAALHEASRTDYALDGIDILGARFGAALRRGWDSAAPVADDGAPYWVEPAEPPRDNPADFARVSPDPGSGYATIATLRARVAELEAQLEAQLAGARAVAQTRSGKCVSGDGMTYSVCRWSTDNIYVELDFDGVKTGAVIPRVDILAALGLRASL
jgi:hypothetical protein